MKRILGVSVGVLVFLAGCSAPVGSPTVVAPAPAPSDIEPEEWAASYPKDYDEWSDSVHGVAYLSGNEDAPSCTDCHGAPETGEVYAPGFRLGIPSSCARCHADETLMSKYGVATDVYETYRADYHGTTIEYYRANDPAMWRYEAVCSDCHESHAVYGPDDARSSVASANLLATCQQCHPAAESEFTTASTGHLRTSREGPLLVYLLTLFYKVLIPVVIGLMLAYIGLDIWHRVRGRVKGEEA